MSKPHTIRLCLYTFLLAIPFGLFPIESYDALWHLATGEWIINHLTVPSTDIFSYTAYGQPWVHHEWGSGVIYWVILSLFGPTGLVFLQTILVWGILFFAGRSIQLLTQNKDIPYLSLFILAWLCVMRVMVRPHLFSLFFFSFLFYILHGHTQKKDPSSKQIYLLPPLFLLWANLHGEVLLGIGLFGLFGLGLLSEKKLTQRLLWIGLGSLLLIFVNPYFYQVITFPIQHFNMTQIMSQTQEMVSVFASERGHFIAYRGYLVVLVLFVFLMVKKPRFFSISEWLVTLPLVYLSLRSNRFTALFCIWSIPLILKYVNNSPFLQKHLTAWGSSLFFRARMIIPVFACMVFLLWGGIPNTFSGGKRSIRTGIAPRIVPSGAVDFLKSNSLQHHRIFNDLELGAFLILEGFPVYIDGRTPVYGDDFFNEYVAAHFVPPLFEDLHNQWNFGVVLLARRFDREWAPLHQHLWKHKDWALVYVDDVASVYLDRKKIDADLIKKYELQQSPAAIFW